jgi:hypothetical protein
VVRQTACRTGSGAPHVPRVSISLAARSLANLMEIIIIADIATS